MFLKLQPSRLTLAAAALAWLSLGLCWWLLPLPLPLRLAVILPALALAFFSLAPLRSSSELALSPSGAWALRQGEAGDWRAVELEDALISPFFMVLHFRDCRRRGGGLWPRRRRFSVPVAIDALAFDDFRRLRARLRTARPPL